MAYEKIDRPEGNLYHYTKSEKVSLIIKDGRIRKFRDRETWFCASLEDTMKLMELTVMKEGKLYIDVNGLPRRYPPFVPEDYVILELTPCYQNGKWVIWNQEFPVGTPQEVLELGREFSHLKLGYRGDLKFHDEPKIYRVDELLNSQKQSVQINL